jgi:hypothetical protein
MARKKMSGKTNYRGIKLTGKHPTARKLQELSEMLEKVS